jgi:arylsulfatase A-like enzyme
MSRTLRLALAAACAAPAALAAQAAPAAPAAPSPRPSLVVFITVDQLQQAYLPRYERQLTGGLRRLWTGGAAFTNAHHDHGTTETAPGHAATMSGRFPMHTGIVRNAAGVQDPQAPLLGASGPGASPFRFRGSALIDWLRSADPRARALSVSRKDRGAILPLGRAKQSVFWYSADGRFTTSTYYADTLPTWVQRFNAADPLAAYRGKAWTPLLAAGAYSEPDSVPVESGGARLRLPARALDRPQAGRARLRRVPVDGRGHRRPRARRAAGDAARHRRADRRPRRVVLDHRRRRAPLRPGLARDPRPDPAPRPHAGLFLDSLYRLRDSSRVIVALTADHGVTPYPELHFPGTDPQRGRVAVLPVLDAHKRRLAARGVDTAAAIDFESGMIVIDRPAFAAARVNADSAVGALVADLRTLAGIQRVYRRAELAPLAARGDKYARRWLHATPPDLPAVAFVTQKPYYYWSNVNYATHGSPHDSDSHVPVIFYGAPFRPGKYAQLARVVDMAPTLAAVLGVAPTEPLDGRVLEAALRTPTGRGTTAAAPPASDQRTRRGTGAACSGSTAAEHRRDGIAGAASHDGSAHGVRAPARAGWGRATAPFSPRIPL